MTHNRFKILALTFVSALFILTDGNVAYGAKYVNNGIAEGIPDNGTALTSTINIKDNITSTITDLNVEVNITHPDIGQLELTLISPIGTIVTLASHNGGGTSNYYSTVFNDSAGQTISSAAGLTTNSTGEYQPIGDLFNLNGESFKGVWTLQITDNSTGSVGTLLNWNIRTQDTLTYKTLTLDQAVPGSSAISNSIKVTGKGQVTNVKVGVDISHKRMQDLSLFLTTENGKIELSSGNGGTGTGYIDTVFDDDEPTGIEAGTAPFTGSFRPESSLTTADGGSTEYSWALVVRDNFGSFSGTLHSWYMEVTTTSVGASNDTFVTNEDTAYSGTLKAEDSSGEGLTYIEVTPPANGILSIDNATTGAYTYTPNFAFTGSDSFTFKANNGTSDSNIATVNITVLDATATDVLILWDEKTNINTMSLVFALTNAGYAVHYSDTSEGLYDGTNPAPDYFDAIIHLNGTDFYNITNFSGYSAIERFVRLGGGYIHSEWNTYDLNRTGGAIREVALFEREGSALGDITIDVVPSMASHPVLTNIPVGMTTLPHSINTAYNRGGVYESPTNLYPTKVLMEDNEGNAALAVREYARGRIVGFHHAGNYNGSNVLSDPNIERLYINSVNWAKRDLSALTTGLHVPPFDLGGGLIGIERSDGGDDSNNLDTETGNPSNGFLYNLGILAKDDTNGAFASTEVTAYIAYKGIASATTSDFHPIALSCTPSDLPQGAVCTTSTLLGPASDYSIYFEARFRDGSIFTYPVAATTGTYLPGPQVSLLRGYNTVGIPKDLPELGDVAPTPPLYGTEAFDSIDSYRWISSGLSSGAKNDGLYSKLDGSGVPVTEGEGYFILKGADTTLKSFDVYPEIASASYTTDYLKPGWNLITNPYGGFVKFKDITVAQDSGWSGTLHNAIQDDILKSGFYYYAGSDWGKTYSYISYSEHNTLTPWVGYWIYQKIDATDVRITFTKPD